MITASFDLALWTILFFIIGMIKPKWPLFFLKKPDRFLILVISTVLVMISLTLWGEGTRREKEAKALKTDTPKSITPQSAPVPVPDAGTKVENKKGG
ncbi:MAG: hypothetical protein PHH59_15285 [Methylovulum sp.]|uniref:hypothetical protein n=1 Tax=Methylovulum sp. TaxID=1916980 RepID=UPI00260E0EB2|nr:hypothetical protein [Methylovulum sp.]MDD2725368.1 hypothetical protein [Methylovulum sp.]MDD5124463.1 hypothetical protein [Methylovulum sp.]